VLPDGHTSWRRERLQRGVHWRRQKLIAAYSRKRSMLPESDRPRCAQTPVPGRLWRKVLEAENDQDGAESALTKACAIDANQPHKWYSLALFHMKQRKWQQAEIELRRWAALRPPSTTTMASSRTLARETGRFFWSEDCS